MSYGAMITTGAYKAWEGAKKVGGGAKKVWRGTKAVGQFAGNVGKYGYKNAGGILTGATVASMIPMSAGQSTETDIERMKQNEPDR